MSNDQFSIADNILKLNVIGKIKLKEKLRFETGRILNCTISKESNGRWFASIPVDINDGTEKREKQVKNDVIGLDLGLTSFVTGSDGNKFFAPKPLKKYTNKLARLQRQHSRKVKGSKNKEKSRKKISKLHYKIKSIRTDFLHKLSTKICSENQTIVLEDLKVKNMIKNHKLAKAISDVSWNEFRRQIDYKSKIFDNQIVIADQYYPSSKTCSGCGCVNHDLKLSDRTFTCKHCNLVIDRDFNASLNLHILGLRGIHACGHLDTSRLDLSSSLSIMDEARHYQCRSGNTYLHIL
jgi:putative transposase